MPRPRLRRRICFCPRAQFYKPRGIPLRQLDIVTLFSDELETLRLIDYQGLDQEGAAKQMRVSRITVQRIYKLARRKIAKALVEGKAIRIVNLEEGGE
jgi:predicted DNA-binding protein (UPF0251 family)